MTSVTCSPSPCQFQPFGFSVLLTSSVLEAVWSGHSTKPVLPSTPRHTGVPSAASPSRPLWSCSPLPAVPHCHSLPLPAAPRSQESSPSSRLVSVALAHIVP